jgi:hypothetical protein
MSSVSKQVTRREIQVPKIAVGILLGITVFGMWIVGYDQGHVLSVFFGQEAFDQIMMHEFYHDMRHAAGFPCH